MEEYKDYDILDINDYADEKYDLSYNKIHHEIDSFENQIIAAAKLCYEVCKDKTDENGIPLLFYAFNMIENNMVDTTRPTFQAHMISY